jgi:hypothetical protein
MCCIAVFPNPLSMEEPLHMKTSAVQKKLIAGNVSDATVEAAL